jgi:16S rRNA (uracil1498-N3)-methyltransferase
MGEPGREPDGSGGPHFFVDDLSAPELDQGDRHHASRVLRLQPGEPMTVSDCAGSWRTVRFGEVLEPTGPVVWVPEPPEEVCVGFALVKGAKPELVIQKLTEVGVDRIEPFVADRSVVRWDDEKASKAADRWTSIARSAAMQSRRVRLPVVEEMRRFAELAVPGVVLADVGGRLPGPDDRRILVGPEGGWSPAERDGGLDRVRVGRNVLRAETAAIVAGALLVALRDRLTGPSERSSDG